MKTKHLLLLLACIAAFSSCSSAYRIGQTPDDVYYSPAPPPPVEYVTTGNQQDRDFYAYNNAANSEDMAIRRGINDPGYRSNISLDYGFGYNPYNTYGSSLYNPYSSYYSPYGNNAVTFYSHGYDSYNGYNNSYNGYNNFYDGYNNYNNYSPFSNYYYSPFSNYYYPYIYSYGQATPASNYTGARTYNLGAYRTTTNANRVYNEQGPPVTNNIAPVRTFPAQPVNRNSGVGNLIRRVFSSSDNNTRSYNTRSYNNNDNNTNTNNNNNSSPARTTQTSTSGSNSSSSGSSSAPVRSFRR